MKNQHTMHISPFTFLFIWLSAMTIISCGTDSGPFKGLPFEGGNGTSENPFQVASVEQLQVIGDSLYLDKHFIQMGDIDASASEELQNGSGFKFIGSAEQPFTGSYDGNGFSITNLKINFNKFDQFNGMFGYVKEGVLENITIDNRGRITSLDKGTAVLNSEENLSLRKTSDLQNIDIADMDGVGGLAGINDGGLIRNCHFIG